MIVALIAAALSAIPMALLAWRDPKRLRVARVRERQPLGSGARRLLAAAVLLPGLLIISQGAAAVMIWLAALTTLGWALAEGFAPRTKRQ